jgi:hypothetical protein
VNQNSPQSEPQSVQNGTQSGPKCPGAMFFSVRQAPMGSRKHPDATKVTSGSCPEHPDVGKVTSGSCLEHPDVEKVIAGCSPRHPVAAFSHPKQSFGWDLNLLCTTIRGHGSCNSRREAICLCDKPTCNGIKSNI